MTKNYDEKFESSTKQTNFSKLDPKTQYFIKEKAKRYNFTFQEIKNIVDTANDLDMWDEPSIEAIWPKEGEDTKNIKTAKKKTLSLLKDNFENIKNKAKSYGSFKTNPKNNKKITLSTHEKEKLGLGMCPVASERTRCCNLMTLDAVESCGFDCSYCSIQSFYNQNRVFFDSGFADKLKNLELDPDKTYHIGTGQSSDSLMWGNKEGILDALVEFADKNQNVILEMKTKSKNIEYFLKNDIPKNIICTWSLNPDVIIQNEEHLTASLDERVDAARKLADKDIKVGFHFHPIVHYENYMEEYGEIFGKLLKTFDAKEVAMVSFGTLTFIKPVIKKIKNRDFKSKILQMPIEDVEGKLSYPIEIKEEMFSFAYNAFKEWRENVFFYLCMEPHSLWKEVFGYEYNSNEEFEKEMKKSYFNTIKGKQ